LDYVGSDSATSPETIHQISNHLSRLSIIYQFHGQTHPCRVDDRFKTYLSEVPVLPDDTRLWGFMMYKPPNMSTLVTKTVQLNELWKLRKAAVHISRTTVLPLPLSRPPLSMLR
jgi:hypothetical protein